MTKDASAKVKAKSNSKPVQQGNLCKCGCKEMTRSKKALFRPGHDARFYSKYPHLRPVSHGKPKAVNAKAKAKAVPKAKAA